MRYKEQEDQRMASERSLVALGRHPRDGSWLVGRMELHDKVVAFKHKSEAKTLGEGGVRNTAHVGGHRPNRRSGILVENANS